MGGGGGKQRYRRSAEVVAVGAATGADCKRLLGSDCGWCGVEFRWMRERSRSTGGQRPVHGRVAVGQGRQTAAPGARRGLPRPEQSAWSCVGRTCRTWTVRTWLLNSVWIPGCGERCVGDFDFVDGAVEIEPVKVPRRHQGRCRRFQRSSCRTGCIRLGTDSRLSQRPGRRHRECPCHRERT